MKKVVYMEWVKLRRPARYELGGSAVSPVHISELPEARAAVEINAFDLYGYPPLLRAIADRHHVSPKQIVTTQGTSMANYLIYAALLGRGDEVLVEKPAYEPLLGIARLFGARIKRFARPFRDRFAVDFDDLEKKISRKTRLIVLTNLHNPSGALVTPAELREVHRLARRVGAYVMVDEVYLEFLTRPQRSAVHLGPNMIVTSSLTKAFGFDGLRCGWILAAPKLAEQLWRLQDFMGVNGAVPAEKISVVAFRNLERFRKRGTSILRRNRPLVAKFLREHADKLDCVLPDAGPICFPRLRGRESGTAFAARLLRNYDTVVIPGHFFEMPQHIRIGFGGDTAKLQGGLRQISRASRDSR
jgi:aspartate/methionine/tyrosine aminotransferase